MRSPAAGAALVLVGLALISVVLYHGMFRIATEDGGAAPKPAAAGPSLAAAADDAAAPEPPGPPAPAVSDEARRRAVEHWNAGIIHFQRSDYEKARDQWLLCRQLDAGNADCRDGLERIDKAYGPAGPGPGER